MWRSKIFWLGSGAGAVAILIALGAWLAVFAGTAVSSESSHWADFGAYFGGVVAPILAYASLIGLMLNLIHEQRKSQTDTERKDSQIHFDYGTQSLRRAYENLFSIGENVEIRSDRLAWLTTARLLLAAKKSKEEISTLSVLNMYIGEEEFWRRQFFEVLQPYSPEGFGAQADNFQAGGLTPADGIEERSIRVVYDFLEWPEGQPDPIDDVVRYTDEELRNLRLGRRGIADFIQAKRRMRRGDGPNE